MFPAYSCIRVFEMFISEANFTKFCDNFAAPNELIPNDLLSAALRFSRANAGFAKSASTFDSF
jgi:hypothetical protein